MPVDASTVSRIRQALWPSALAQSIWTFSKSLFTQDIGKQSSKDTELPGKLGPRFPGIDPTGAQQPNVNILNAFAAAQNKLRQLWKKVPNYPPRGSILLAGLIELESPKAYIVVDV